MAEENPVQKDLRRAFRVAWYGSAAMMAIAYAVLFSLKWHGLLPVNMTWSRIVLGPILLGSLVPIAMGYPSRPDSYGFVRLGIWMLLVVALGVAAGLFDLITGCP
jgi:hypothetical protein